jgi:hypothetical protein
LILISLSLSHTFHFNNSLLILTEFNFDLALKTYPNLLIQVFSNPSKFADQFSSLQFSGQQLLSQNVNFTLAYVDKQSEPRLAARFTEKVDPITLLVLDSVIQNRTSKELMQSVY